MLGESRGHKIQKGRSPKITPHCINLPCQKGITHTRIDLICFLVIEFKSNLVSSITINGHHHIIVIRNVRIIGIHPSDVRCATNSAAFFTTESTQHPVGSIFDGDAIEFNKGNQRCCVWCSIRVDNPRAAWFL